MTDKSLKLREILKNLTSEEKIELEKWVRSEMAWDNWCHNCQKNKIYRTDITSNKKLDTINNALARSSLCYIRDRLTCLIAETEEIELEKGKTANWIEVLNNWQQHGYCFFYFNLSDWILVE